MKSWFLYCRRLGNFGKFGCLLCKDHKDKYILLLIRRTHFFSVRDVFVKSLSMFIVCSFRCSYYVPNKSAGMRNNVAPNWLISLCRAAFTHRLASFHPEQDRPGVGRCPSQSKTPCGGSDSDRVGLTHQKVRLLAEDVVHRMMAPTPRGGHSVYRRGPSQSVTPGIHLS